MICEELKSRKNFVEEDFIELRDSVEELISVIEKYKDMRYNSSTYIDDLKEEEIEELKKEDLEYSNQFIKNKYPKTYEYSVDMTEESVKQAMQGLEYEINSLSTVNGQTPFTTIGIGTETSWEGRLVQKYVLKTRMAGFGAKKETAIFPKIVYAMCEGCLLYTSDAADE